jgi:peroxiredoxin Q/BCP
MGGQSRVSLSDFAKQTLVLFFYPRDNTPGCTREAQAFTAASGAIKAAGGVVVGVSRDSLKSHQSFREKCALGIPLLSDPDLSVHKAYGAWGTKTMYGKKVEGVIRSTFLVKNGKVVRVFPNVKVDGHAEAVLKAIGELSSGTPAVKTTAKTKAKKRTTAKAKAKTPTAKERRGKSKR